jgi:hypothetical protein
MFGLMTKAAHEAVIAALKTRLEDAKRGGEYWETEYNRQVELVTQARRERDEARAELAPLKAAKEARIARLATANAARRAEAAERTVN